MSYSDNLDEYLIDGINASKKHQFLIKEWMHINKKLKILWIKKIQIN